MCQVEWTGFLRAQRCVQSRSSRPRVSNDASYVAGDPAGNQGLLQLDHSGHESPRAMWLLLTRGVLVLTYRWQLLEREGGGATSPLFLVPPGVPILWPNCAFSFSGVSEAKGLFSPTRLPPPPCCWGRPVRCGTQQPHHDGGPVGPEVL